MRVQGGDRRVRSAGEHEVEKRDVTGLPRGHAVRHALRGRESLARRHDVPFAQQDLRFTGMGEREAWIGSNGAVERHDRAGIEGQRSIAA